MAQKRLRMSEPAQSSQGVSPPSETVTVSLLSGRSAQVPATDRTALQTIREEAGSKLGVRIARLMRADGSALEEQQTLAEAGIDLQEPLQAVVCSIAVGSRVTLKAGVVEPAYGWGSMTRGDCGIVTSINNTNITINFPSQSGWSGKLDEMELADTMSPEVEVIVTVSLLSGRSAQVPATDRTALQKIREEAGSKLGVRIARLMRADGAALEEQQTLAEAGIDLQEPLQAVVCSFAVGSRVRLKAGVVEPAYGWGEIERGECGVVTSINAENVRVNFPSQSGWSGKLDEMELAETMSPEVEVIVTVSLLSGRSAQVPATDRTALHKIREEAGSKLGVRIARLMRADGSALEEQQTLAEAGIDLQEPLQAVVCSIAVGSRVTLKAGVVEPAYGWGSMTRGDCGIVTSINNTNITINFPSQSGWSGKLDEMELAEEP